MKICHRCGITNYLDSSNPLALLTIECFNSKCDEVFYTRDMEEIDIEEDEFMRLMGKPPGE